MTSIDVVGSDGAFDVMLKSLTVAEAGPTQINGVSAWQGTVAIATAEGEVYCTAAQTEMNPAGRQVDGFETTTHRSWVAMCEAITKAMGNQRSQAVSGQEYWQALAWSHRRARDYWYLRAAAAIRNREVHDRCVAQAEAHDLARVRCEELADLAGRWQAAAEVAATDGVKLTRGVTVRIEPIGEAIARQGLADTAKAKQYHTV